MLGTLPQSPLPCLAPIIVGCSATRKSNVDCRVDIGQGSEGAVITRVLYGGFLLIAGVFVALLMSATLVSELTRQTDTPAVWILVYAFFLSLASCVALGGFRLVRNRPHPLGGMFSPNMLRYLAIVNAGLGGLSAYLSWQDGSVVGMLSSATYIVATQSAFSLANRRESEDGV